MNQILDFGDGNNDNNGGKNKKPIKEKKVNKKDNSFGGGSFGGGSSFGGNNTFDGGINFGSKPSSGKGKLPVSDKVVKIFALLMIILAVALIGSGLTSLMKNKKDTTNQNANKAPTEEVKAEILAELDETTGKVRITVNSPITISKMIYSWDKDHDNVVSGEKQTSLEEEVIAPYGEHVLHVQVIDEQNNKSSGEFTFTSETGMDTTQPDITLKITEDKKLSITATDDTSIAYVTYTWNEEVVTMTPEEEGLTEYSFEIEIPRGKNTIVVVAVDGSESSNARTTSKVLEGVTKPNINYIFLDQAGSELQIICTHESGIKSIYYTLNGQPYQWEAQEGEEPPKELSFVQKSAEGYNEMTITVTSVDDTVAEFNPAWDYNPAPATPATDETENTGTGSALEEE